MSPDIRANGIMKDPLQKMKKDTVEDTLVQEASRTGICWERRVSECANLKKKHTHFFNKKL